MMKNLIFLFLIPLIGFGQSKDIFSKDFVPPTLIFKNIFILTDKNVYSKENPIPLNPRFPPGLIFNIQLGTFRKPLKQDHYKGFAPIYIRKGRDDLFYYSVGFFKSFEAANSVKKQLKNNYGLNTIVAAFNNGERITVSEAKILLEPKSSVKYNRNVEYLNTTIYYIDFGTYGSDIPEDLDGNNLQLRDFGIKSRSRFGGTQFFSKYYFSLEAAKIALNKADIIGIDCKIAKSGKEDFKLNYEYKVVLISNNDIETFNIENFAKKNSIIFEVERKNGSLRFYTESRDDYESAVSDLKAFKTQGFKDAIIVAYKDGLKITFEEKPSEIKESLPTINNQILSSNNNIDNNIPLTTKQSENTYALIIGNEDYSTHQTGLTSEVNVKYASNDSEIFKKYCTKTLGVHERHIKFLKDATAGQMKQGLAWINNLAKVTDGKANLIFYYAGHGLPDQETKTPYLMPVDVSGSYINLGISLDEVITSLSQYPTKKSVIFLDACFSGGARNEGLVAMRGVKIKPKEENLLGNLVILSSSSGNESSGSYDNKKHGMFTYFLLKKLQETKGTANLKQLSDFIYSSVRKESALSGKIQTPQVQSSSSVGKDWESWILAE